MNTWILTVYKNSSSPCSTALSSTAYDLSFCYNSARLASQSA